MSICCVVGIAAAAIGAMSHLFWSPGWPQRVPASAFTTTKPSVEDVAGVYLLKGKQCQLDLHSDGTFQVTNYPTWSVSTSGHWQVTSPGITYDGSNELQLCGIQLTGAAGQVDSLTLTGKSPPYGLIKLAEDPDEGALLTFQREK